MDNKNLIIGWRLYSKDLFDIEHISLNAELLFERAARRAKAFVFTRDSFIDRLVVDLVPPGVEIRLVGDYDYKPKKIDKVVPTFKVDYVVYIFDTEQPPIMSGRRLVVDLVKGTEQWILD